MEPRPHDLAEKLEHVHCIPDATHKSVAYEFHDAAETNCQKASCPSHCDASPSGPLCSSNLYYGLVVSPRCSMGDAFFSRTAFVFA